MQAAKLAGLLFIVQDYFHYRRPAMAVLVLAKNGPRTKSGSIFWSGLIKRLPDLVLGPFLAAWNGPTLPVLVPLDMH